VSDNKREARIFFRGMEDGEELAGNCPWCGYDNGPTVIVKNKHSYQIECHHCRMGWVASRGFVIGPMIDIENFTSMDKDFWAKLKAAHDEKLADTDGETDDGGFSVASRYVHSGFADRDDALLELNERVEALETLKDVDPESTIEELDAEDHHVLAMRTLALQYSHDIVTKMWRKESRMNAAFVAEIRADIERYGSDQADLNYYDLMEMLKKHGLEKE